MNPCRTYRDEWARALSGQAMAEAYTSFVAITFLEAFHAGASGRSCASLHDDHLAFSIGRHATQALFAAILENQCHRLRGAVTSFVLGAALAIRTGNFRGVRMTQSPSRSNTAVTRCASVPLLPFIQADLRLRPRHAGCRHPDSQRRPEARSRPPGRAFAGRRGGDPACDHTSGSGREHRVPRCRTRRRSSGSDPQAGPGAESAARAGHAVRAGPRNGGRLTDPISQRSKRRCSCPTPCRISRPFRPTCRRT